jgi:anaerobic magnesium-protoporphyrin IX monomethyl ester cyclase
VRQRDLSLVANEIRTVVAEREVRHVRFYDDVFAYNEKKLASIRHHIAPLEVTFDCYIRIDITTPRMLELLRESGCIQVRFGVETGNDALRSLRKGGRTVSFEKHRQIVDACRALGIETQASYIFGFPDETLSDMEATIDFADRLDTDQVGFYKLTPYPGTIYWQMIDPDEISLEDYCKFDNQASVNPHVGADDILGLLERAYVRYYSKRAIPYDRPDTLRFLTSLPKLRY